MHWSPGSLATQYRPTSDGGILNRENPMTAGFSVVVVPLGASAQNVARSLQPTRIAGGTFERGASAVGQSMRVTGQPTSGNTGNSGGFSFPPNIVDLTGPFTLLFVGAPASFQSNSVAITGQINAWQAPSGDGPTMRWGPGLSVPNAKRLRGFANIGGVDRTIDDGTNSVEGVLYVNILTYDGAELSLWSNGRLVGAIACSGVVRVTGYTALTVLNDYQDMSFPRDGFGARGFMGEFHMAAAASRGLSRAEVASLTRNPWQLVAPSFRPLWAPSPVASAYRPGSDINANGWTATPSGSLFDRINETTLDTGDFITSPNLTNSVTLGWDVSVPTGTTTIRINAQYLGTVGQVRVVMLDSGGSSVGNTNWQALTASAATYDLPVTTTGISTQFRIEVQ